MKNLEKASFQTLSHISGEKIDLIEVPSTIPKSSNHVFIQIGLKTENFTDLVINIFESKSSNSFGGLRQSCIPPGQYTFKVPIFFHNTTDQTQFYWHIYITQPNKSVKEMISQHKIDITLTSDTEKNLSQSKLEI